MWFVQWLYTLYQEEYPLAWITFFATGVFVLFAVVCYLLDNAGCFVALSALVLGVGFVALAGLVQNGVARLVGGGVLFVAAGSVYLALSLALGIKGRIANRRAKCAEVKRR